MFIAGIFGITLNSKGLKIAPNKQKDIKVIETHIVYQGKSILLKIADDTLTLLTGDEVKVNVYDQEVIVSGVYHTSVK